MVTVEAVQNIPTGGDPVLETLKWIAVFVVIVMIGAAPVMSYLRKFKADSAASAKDDASVTLYNQLQEQIRRLSDDVTLLVSEKNKWFEEATSLRIRAAEQERRIEALVESENINRRLRERLDEKDRVIASRDAENRQLMLEMLSLKDRLHSLELRLAQDEEKFCEKCIHGQKQVGFHFGPKP